MEIKGELVFRKKPQAFEDHIKECIDILGVSHMMYKVADVKAFLKVIAVQLRILLCDGKKNKDSLILKINDNPLLAKYSDELLIDNEDFRMVNPVIDLNNEVKLPLNEWLEQEVLWTRSPYYLPKYAGCPYCTLHEHKQHDMWLISNQKGTEVDLDASILTTTCVLCGSRFSIDIDPYQHGGENAEKHFMEQSITIYTIIRVIADKSGGAHVDKALKSLSFYANGLGEKHLIAVAEYIIEYLGYDLVSEINKPVFLKLLTRLQEIDDL